MINLATVDAGDAVARVALSVRITGMKAFRVRLWFGKRLIRLSAFVIGVGRVEVTAD